MRTFYLVFLCAVCLVGCGQNQQQKAFKVFNKGVAFSLSAVQETNAATAAILERKAIAKYQQTLQIDSSHRMARATMGHSYYLLDEYPQAIQWFEASNRLDTTSVAVYRELGICRIAMNQTEQGWNDLQNAFRLDSSSATGNLAETKKITADDLSAFGCQAFEHGETYDQQGKSEEGRGFKEFGLNILFMAYDIDPARKDIAKAIAERTGKLGDVALQKKYLKLSK